VGSKPSRISKNHDEVFGDLTWNNLVGWGCWEGSTAINYFRDFGTTLASIRDKQIQISFPAHGNKAKRPNSGQRLAWKKVLERGDAIWDELMAKLLVQYRADRPIHLRWWLALYGDKDLDRRMPEVADVSGLAKLIRADVLSIHENSTDDEIASLAVLFTCTWCSPCAVRIKNAQIDRIDEQLNSPEAGSVLHHPSLGEIHQMGGMFRGAVRCEPFREFTALAKARAAYRDAPSDFDPPRSKLSWGFVRGEFPLMVYVKQQALPSEHQCKAVGEFQRDAATACHKIIPRIFDYYQARRAEFRRMLENLHGDELAPAIENVEGLRELIKLQHVNVFPEDADGNVDLGVVFYCVWNRNGVGVRWRNGTVVEIGERVVGQPLT
jgi:hypothetical protein